MFLVFKFNENKNNLIGLLFIEYLKINIVLNIQHKELVVIGSGMGGLSAAALLTSEGFKVTVLEANLLPGGCTSTYYRKGYLFEAGATTLVGLDDGMPLWYVLQKCGIELNAMRLLKPMQVYLKNGVLLTRYENINDWIAEAERIFGKKNQRVFWEKCFEISRFVWNTSLNQLHFPPATINDLLQTVKNASLKQVRFLPYSFTSVYNFLEQHELHTNELFVEFINEQLLITAQNNVKEVNMLFGATALCYTNIGNYYIQGGLIEMVKPLIQYIESKGGEFVNRTKVEGIEKHGDKYVVATNKETYKAEYLISNLPINNLLDIWNDKMIHRKFQSKIFTSEKLVSAFQMGIAFKRTQYFDTLHHQIHLDTQLPQINSKSVFVSLNHAEDSLRCPPDCMVASISTHVLNPEKNKIHNKVEIEDAILNVLISKGFFSKADILYYHSATPETWQKWVFRKWGFVGGYPQYMKVKPWQMLEHRLDNHKAYIVGDSVYPGQGIPGVVLSGIIAANKLLSDSGIHR